MKKTIKHLLIKSLKILAMIFLAMLLAGAIFIQIQCEKEIKEQLMENGVLEKRKRTKWTPALLYIIYNNYKTNSLDVEAFNLPYDSIGGYEGKKLIPYNHIQLYILHCFYTDEEKKNNVLGNS